MRRLLASAVVAELVVGGVGVAVVTRNTPASRSLREAVGTALPAVNDANSVGAGSSTLSDSSHHAGSSHHADRHGRDRVAAHDSKDAGTTPEQISFAAPRDFATGATPSSTAFNVASGDQTIPLALVHLPMSNSVAVGDFNEDGLDDVVETNVIASSMSVFLGNGNGGFAAPVVSSVGGLPSFVVAGRLDLDDHLDLAIAELGSNDVAILHGDGRGGFTQPDRIPIPGPRHIAIGDLEGDGVPDLAVAAAGPAYPPKVQPFARVGSPAGAVVVLGGVRGASGAVTFGGTRTQILTDSASLDSNQASAAVVVALVDLNGDGQDDVVAASGYRRNAGDELPGGEISGDDVFVHLHRPRTAVSGDPFDAAPSQPALRVGGSPEGIAVGDFDRDSHPDVAVLGSGSGDVTTLLGSATGLLTVKVCNVTLGMLPRSLVTADLNGDGLLDLVTAGFGAGTAGVLVGRGDGTFAPSIDHWIGDEPTSVAVGDFDGDRRLDVVAGRVRDDSLSLLVNRGPGPGDGVVISRDQHYLPSAGDPFAAHHTIDVYEPPRGAHSFAGRSKPYPVLIFFHGSGFTTNKTMWALVLRRLAGEGFLVTSAEYRLDDKADDAQTMSEIALALRWTIAHAPGYHADPTGLTVMGHSYGGEIAMEMLAAAENIDILRHVKAFVALSGISANYLQAPLTILDRQKAGGPALPALLLINGTDGFEQALVGQSIAADAALRAAGADSRQCVFAGRDHFSGTSHLALDDDPARRALEQFLRARPVDCPV